MEKSNEESKQKQYLFKKEDIIKWLEEYPYYIPDHYFDKNEEQKMKSFFKGENKMLNIRNYSNLDTFKLDVFKRNVGDNSVKELKQPTLLPDDTYLLQNNIRSGNAKEDPALTKAKYSDCLYLNTKLTVLEGPYTGKFFWQRIGIWSPPYDLQTDPENLGGIYRMIGRTKIYTILRYAYEQGNKPISEEVRRTYMQHLPTHGCLEGMRFYAKTIIDGKYPAQSVIDCAVPKASLAKVDHDNNNR
jgi:hypothetical protein